MKFLRQPFQIHTLAETCSELRATWCECFGRITRSLKSQLVPFHTINSTGTLTHDMIATLFTVPCMRCEIQRHPAHRVSMRVFHTTVLERHNHPLRSWLEIPGVFASCLKPRGCSQVDKGRKSPENFRKKGPPREQTDKRHRPFPNEFLA